jgi:hypothetical protein
MSERASFKPRVIEPVAINQPDGLGLAVELWLAHPVDGIAGRAVQIHLRGDARMAQAEALRDLLHQLGTNRALSAAPLASPSSCLAVPRSSLSGGPHGIIGRFKTVISSYRYKDSIVGVYTASIDVADTAHRPGRDAILN